MKHHSPANRSHKPDGALFFKSLTIFVMALAIGCFALVFWPKGYTTTAVLKLAADSSGQPVNFSSDQVKQIRSENFLSKIAEQLELSKKWETQPEQTTLILSRFASIKRNDGSLEISYFSKDQQEAIAIANGISSNYAAHWRSAHTADHKKTIGSVTSDRDRLQAESTAKAKALDNLQQQDSEATVITKAQDELTELDAQKAVLQQRLVELQTMQQRLHDEIAIEQAASADNSIYGVNTSSAISFIIFFALLVTMISALYLSLRRGKSEITQIAKAIPGRLAVVPRSKDHLGAYKRPFEQIIEKLLTTFPNPQGIAISTVPYLLDEDASTQACELAKSLAATGHPTILIDSNVNNPSLHKAFNASPQPGLADFITGKSGLKGTVFKTKSDNLWIMPSGVTKGKATPILNNDEMADLVNELSSRFDFLVLNTSPLLYSVESLNLIGLTNLTYLCSESKTVTTAQIKQADSAISDAGGRLASLILTNVSPDDISKIALETVPIKSQ